MKEFDISKELYRHYTIHTECGVVHGVHIDNPQSLFYESGHKFHRVWDGKIVWLAPAPGPLTDVEGKIIGWVELVWCPKDKNKPVQF